MAIHGKGQSFTPDVRLADRQVQQAVQQQKQNNNCLEQYEGNSLYLSAKLLEKSLSIVV